MNHTLKIVIVSSITFYVLWAIFDYFNQTAALLLPYTYIKGLITGTQDPTVSTLNQPGQTGN